MTALLTVIYLSREYVITHISFWTSHNSTDSKVERLDYPSLKIITVSITSEMNVKSSGEVTM